MGDGSYAKIAAIEECASSAVAREGEPMPPVHLLFLLLMPGRGVEACTISNLDAEGIGHIFGRTLSSPRF